MSVLAKFSLARIAIFLVTYVLLWGICQFFLEFGTLTNLVVLVAAFIISSIISIFALSQMRDHLAGRLQGVAQQMSRRVEESRRAEDDD